MPLGAARITLLAKTSVAVAAEVIRTKAGVQAVGNAVISTADSKWGGASLNVPGTDDAIRVRFDRTLDLSGDFTFECWAKGRGYSTRGKIFALYTHYPAAADSIFIDVNNSTFIRCYIDGADRVTTATWDYTVWNHIVLQRQSGVFNMFVNGTRILNYDQSSSPKDYSLDNSEDHVIGSTWTSAGGYTDEFNGYIDELRWCSAAKYTNGASITVPTAPFVNDDDTGVLLHFDGTNNSTFIEDDNGTGRSAMGVTSINSATVSTTQSKFGNASLSLSATDRNLQVSNDVVDWDVIGANSGDYTIEGWIYCTNNATTNVIFGSRTSTAQQGWDLEVRTNNGNGTLRWFNAESNLYYSSGGVISNNTWHHVAVVKQGSSVVVYVDGTSVISASPSSYTASNAPLYIGVSGYPTLNVFYGYIDEVRVSDTARYTTNFTAPTAPFVNDSNTLLLLHMDGTNASTVFRDDNGKDRSSVGITAIGNAQVDTAQSKFGGASALLDGTGDYLRTAFLNEMEFGTNDFTMEAWINTNVTTSQVIISGRYGTGVNASENNNVLAIVSGKLSWSDGSTWVIQDASTISTGTWIHVAVVRSSGTVTVYKDGTSVGSTSYTTSITNARPVYIGSFNVGTVNFNGWIDEVRISSTARYTTGFTPDTQPFVNDTNTLLLLHMNGTDGSTTFVDDNGTYTV